MDTAVGDRGRNATLPEQIPAQGWWDIVVRVKGELGRDNVSLIAGGLAMYALLSVFPAMTAAVSFYGLLVTPADVISQMNSFSGVLPPGAWRIFSAELQDVARQQAGTLTLAAVTTLVVALASARSGMAALMQAANIAYREREKRGLLRQVIMSIGFTLGAILGFILMLLLGVAVPLLVKLFTSAWAEILVSVLRWALLWAFAALGLAMIYRFGPAREHARWRWVSWGSVAAATLWLIGSVLFSLYVRNLGNYTRTYGALGGVVVLLLWFYLSSFFVVLGAVINAEMERQTRRDTTEGPEAPLGKRGAYAADTVGPSVTQIEHAKQEH